MSKPNKIVVAANPSLDTSEEQDFWNTVSRLLRAKDWQFISLATRGIPNTTDGLKVTMAARTWQLYGNLKSQYPFSYDQRPDWFSEKTHKLHLDWEMIRWELQGVEQEVYRGLAILANYIETSFNLLKPAFVFTTNKIDHNVAFFRMAAKYRGIETALSERSPINNMWIEPDGLFQESDIWNKWPHAKRNEDISRYTAIGEKEISQLRADPYGHRKEAVVHEQLPERITGFNGPVFFLPMDNVLWTGWQQKDHPQNPVDSPIVDDPIVAINKIHESVKQLNGLLVIKKHPADLYLTPERLDDDIVFIDTDIKELIKASDVVICFNTKVAFPALALGKAVVTLAPNPVAAEDVTYHTLKLAEVPEVLAAALNKVDLENKLENYKPFLGWLATRFFYSNNISTDPNYRKDPQVLVEEILEKYDARTSSVSKSWCEQVAENLLFVARANPKGKYSA
jgi:hypothetical protein